MGKNLINYFFVLLALCLCSFSWGETDNFLIYKRGLDDKISAVRDSVEDSGSADIYAGEKSKIRGIKKILVGDSSIEVSARNLLQYLEENNGTYYSLGFDNWVLTVRSLYEADDLIGSGSGWGNIVIKINICNKVIFGALYFLTEGKDNLSDAQINTLAEIIKDLRLHYPARTGLFNYAIKYYGYTTDDFSGLSQSISVSEEENKLGGEVSYQFFKREYSGNSEKYEKDIGIISEEEINLISSNQGYLYLYDNPTPWELQKFSKYKYYLWDLYFYAKFIKEKGKRFDGWSTLNPADVLYFLHNEIQHDDGFWMTNGLLYSVRHADSFISDPWFNRLRNTGGGLNFIQTDHDVAFGKKKKSDYFSVMQISQE